MGGGKSTRTVEYRTDPAVAEQMKAMTAMIAGMQQSAQQSAQLQAAQMKREDDLRKEREEMRKMYEQQQKMYEAQQAEARRVADELKQANAQADEERAAFSRRLQQMSAAQKRQEITSQLQLLQGEQVAVRQERVLQEEKLDQLARELASAEATVAELEAQCRLEEEKLRSSFPEEYDAPGTKRLVLLGITGNGKSTFGNRLCGDASEDSDKGPFATSHAATSVTKLIKAHAAKLLGTPLSVVDTPGTFDTEGEDRFHANQLVEYLRGCGGVDAFLVFKNGTDARLDEKYEAMLKDLEQMLGREFFAHVIIIATHVEPGRATRQFNKIKDGFRAEILRKLKLEGSGVPMPMIGVGLDQYEEALRDLMAKLPGERYMSESLKGPLDVLREQLAQEQATSAAKQQQVAAMRDVIAQLDERARNTAINITDLERQLQSPVAA